MGRRVSSSAATVAPVVRDEEWIRRELKLFKNPVETMRHFAQAVARCSVVITTDPRFARRALLWGAPTTLVMCGVFCNKKALYCAWWLCCGIMSTIGLGTGLQTGALFLFPHVADVAKEWARCGDVAAQFDRIPFRSHEPHACGSSTGRWHELMLRVALPGFFSGAGSALGELLPYALARAMVAHGHDPFALLPDTSDTSDQSSESSETTDKRRTFAPKLLLSKTRTALQDQLRTSSFWKIFVLAAVPNALFDLCGLVCGSIGVSFPTFFFAVFAAKAVVRTPLQTTILAALVSWHDQGAVDKLSSLIFRRTTTTTTNPFKIAWTSLTLALFAAFLASLVDQIAQQRALHCLRRRGDDHHERNDDDRAPFSSSAAAHHHHQKAN